jgi:ABC-type Na+ efflux pump permease subunit
VEFRRIILQLFKGGNMMNSAQKAIISKDIKEVLREKQMLLPMIIVPLIMMIIFPTAMLIMAKYGAHNLNGLDALIKILPDKYKYQNNSQLIIDVAVNYMFPSLFLLIPVMSSTIIGASSFVVERERKTMETLLYTPTDIKTIMSAKIIGTAIPAYIIALISIVTFGVIVNIGGWVYFKGLIFPNIKWIILILWVTPAITLLGISFMVLISAKSKTFQEAQQKSIFIILPIILLVVGQASGLFLINTLIMIIIGLIIYVLDYFLIINAARRFIPENLI